MRFSLRTCLILLALTLVTTRPLHSQNQYVPPPPIPDDLMPFPDDPPDPFTIPFDPNDDLPDPSDFPLPPEDPFDLPLPDPFDLPLPPPDIEDPFEFGEPSLFPDPDDVFPDIPDLPLPDLPPDLPEALVGHASPSAAAGLAVNVPFLLMPFPRPLLFRPELTVSAGATKPPCDPNFSSTVLIPESNSNTLAFVATCPHSVTARVVVGNSPVSVASMPNAQGAWVGNSDDGTVSVVNLSTKTTIVTIPLRGPDGSQPMPNQVVFLPDGSLAYVSDHDCNPGSYIFMVNTSTYQPVGTISVGCYPSAMAVSPDGSQLWVAQRGDGVVDVYDTLTNAHVVRYTVPLATGIAFNPTGTRAYMAVGDSPGTILVVDTGSYQIIARIPVGQLPHVLAVTPTGRHLFVTNLGESSITQIDALNNTVIRTIQLPAQHPLGLTFIH